ncbi:MAG: class I SAM-dependent methyltransferase [Candidatus Hydrogenedentes bacterium]|nr:class I SAM-dependent methyltransferase [Candidatus Hydrogenedentota bacterium]
MASNENDPPRGGNLYDKYASKNPIARALFQGFMASLRDLLPASLDSTSRIVEVGCGEGHLLNLIHQHYGGRVSCMGYDLDPAVISQAKSLYPHLHFEVKNVEEITFPENPPELLICCEVLEHVSSPTQALERLAAIPCKHYILSVPREPIWCVLNLLRFKYVSALGNTPGHINHWTQAQFRRLVQEYFSIERLRAPFPWTMVLVRRSAIQ